MSSTPPCRKILTGDKLTQKHRDSSRGEDYAEKFANSPFEQLLPAYIGVFGDPKFGG